MKRSKASWTSVGRVLVISADSYPTQGPSGTWSGLQFTVPPWVSWSSLRPRSLEPGQRSRYLRPRLLSRVLLGLTVQTLGLATSSRPQGTPGTAAENVLSVVAIRPIPPKASDFPDCPKSSNQPVSSGL